ELGGHVDLGRMQTGLNSLHPTEEGIAELGRTVGDTHYKFALEFLWGALLGDSPGLARPEQFERPLRDTATLMTALIAVYDVIRNYVDHRKPRSHTKEGANG